MEEMLWGWGNKAKGVDQEHIVDHHAWLDQSCYQMLFFWSHDELVTMFDTDRPWTKQWTNPFSTSKTNTPHCTRISHMKTYHESLPMRVYPWESTHESVTWKSTRPTVIPHHAFPNPFSLAERTELCRTAFLALLIDWLSEKSCPQLQKRDDRKCEVCQLPTNQILNEPQQD